MSPVSLHDLPEEIKRHIENESLNVVEKLRASSISFILIGGWAARAIGGADHDRYTFDVDGVLGSNSDFDAIAVILSDEGMEVTKFDWGQTYSRRLKLPLNLTQKLSGEQRDLVSKSKIKLELSTSRIYSADSKYFFDFRMDKSRGAGNQYEKRTVYPCRRGIATIRDRVQARHIRLEEHLRCGNATQENHSRRARSGDRIV